MTESKTRVDLCMSNAAYHAHPAISKSGLDKIAKSPAHFKYGNGFTGSTATRVGSAFHSWILEDREPLVGPEVQRRSKVDRQEWADWMSGHGANGDAIIADLKADAWLTEFAEQTGRDVLNPAESQEAAAMRESLARNPEARRLLLDTPGIAEMSIFSEIEGIPVRARPDYVHRDRHCIVDLKTAASARGWDWGRAAATRRYHVQQAMYSQISHDVLETWPCDFAFVVVESSAPYCCVVYRLASEAVENGNYLMLRDLETYRECMESGEWPGYPNDDSLQIPLYERETFSLELDGETLDVS